MVVQQTSELRRRVAETAASLAGAIENEFASRRREIDHLAVRLREPVNLIRQGRQRADEAAGDLSTAVTGRLNDLRRSVRELSTRVISPLALVRERRLHASRMALRLAQTLRAKSSPLRLAIAEVSARLDEANLRASLAVRRTRIETLAGRLATAFEAAVETRRIRLGGIARQLDSVSPLKVLDRGYAMVVNRRDKRAVSDASTIEIGDELDIRLRRGRLNARATGREV
jgi:exodeoxyribonuclease VII large subunit